MMTAKKEDTRSNNYLAGRSSIVDRVLSSGDIICWFCLGPWQSGISDGFFLLLHHFLHRGSIQSVVSCVAPYGGSTLPWDQRTAMEKKLRDQLDTEKS